MGAGGYPGVTDLDEDAVALIVILAVAVGLLQQRLRVADLTSDAAARHRLEVRTGSERLGAELLNTDGVQRLMKRGWGGGAGVGVGGRGPTCLQYLVIAAPSGCSLLFSAVPTMASSRDRGILFPSTTILTWITLGAPYVMVPVLSNTTD